VGLFGPSRDQQYSAALAIYLAAHTYETMTVEQRQEVDAQVYRSMEGKLVGYSKVEFQRLWPPAFKAAWRAFAMNDLGIPPAVDGESWHLPKARAFLGVPGAVPSKLYGNYRFWDEGATQAKVYLQAKGVDVRALDV
jgi:hypothetical protein